MAVKINKTFIGKLVKNPTQVLASLEADDVAALIEYVDDKYYNDGAPVISDDLYDHVREHMRKIEPKHPVLNKVGAKINVGDSRKEKLPYFMGSMDKIKSDNTTLDNFRNKYIGNYVFADKLDGNSALLYCKVGHTPKLFTRGNGVEGQNVSHLLQHIQGIPNLEALMKKFSEVTVRGELIIAKEDFEEVADQGANARNMVAGLVNAKRPNMELIGLVQFVAYTLIAPVMKPSEQMTWLYRNGFRTVHSKVTDSGRCSFQSMSEFLLDRREKSEYEIDGIIVTHDDIYKVENGTNPSYAFAFKSIMTQDNAEVVVTNVEWNISKDGYLKPVVEFSPVKLAGVMIKRATGFHGSFIHTNKIGPGARVIITRSGDVIPYIVKILKPAESGSAQMPEVEYEWNETCKEIMVSGTNEEVDYKQVENFFTKVKIHGLSSATIRKFYDQGLDTASKILNASQDDFAEIIGEKTAAKIHTAMTDMKKKLDCVVIMDASNMFGRGFGEKRLRSIVDAFPQIENGIFIPSKEQLLTVSGVSTVTAEKFIYGLQRYRMFMNDSDIQCSRASTSNAPKEAGVKGQKMKDQVVLFTGFRDKELGEAIEAQGGRLVEAFSKKVTLVVAKDPTENSGKIKSARNANIPVLSKDQMLAKL